MWAAVLRNLPSEYYTRWCVWWRTLGNATTTQQLPDASLMAQQRWFKGLIPAPPCDGTHTHVDDRILELDVEPVVRNGNDGFISMAQIFNPFPLKNWERHLKQRISRENMMHTDCWLYSICCWEKQACPGR